MRQKMLLPIVLCVIIVFNLVGCTADERVDLEDKKDGDVVQTVTNESLETMEYMDKLFDQSVVHEINVEIDEEDWSDLKTNPLIKTKYMVQVTIDGETFQNVSFATKGNTSLSSVASDSDSDRYSFKINFGKYEEEQNYYGLDQLNLNNLYADATYMKDYISYEIFRAVGVDAPLTSYVELKINGESFGLYLAIEEVGDSYLKRTGNENSELYKPETEMLANMDNQFQKTDKQNGEIPDPAKRPDGGEFNPPNGEDGAPSGRGFMGNSSSGADLVYTDDILESYSDIFNNAETDVTEEDEKRVIEALSSLSKGDAETALDVSEVINYFVAHNFVLNYDSYTGTMLHNYYLMEANGKLSVIPWDYNLAFGGFGGFGDASRMMTDVKSNDEPSLLEHESDATELLNSGIDSPLSGANESERPLWSFITSNDEYLNQYHESYSALMDYLNSAALETEMNRVYNMIYSYVKSDPSAFYTISEFEKAYQTLLDFCNVRKESITKQLNGELAMITDEQSSQDQVDASFITITDMGSQGGK